MSLTINELSQSHSIGFGGSDAQCWLSAGKNGILSITAKERIKDVKWGRISTFNANTDAQKAGHDFEQKIKDIYPHFTTEYKLEKVLYKSFPFKTYAHADFFNKGFVYECKFVQNDIEKVIKKYQAQLQWYFMMGAERVFLIHGTGKIDDGFASINDLNIVEIKEDKEIQKTIIKGLKLAKEYFNQLPKCELDEIQEEATLENLAFELGNLQGALNDIELQIKEKKVKLIELMKEKEIDKVESENAKITYICPQIRQSFDTAKFKKENEETYKKYLKETQTADGLRINIIS